MPCHAALMDKTLTATPDQSVGDVLKMMTKTKPPFVAVIDEDNVLQGVFSYRILYRNLLPVSVAMNDGIQMDVTVSAAPGIAKRLKKVKPLPVSEFMDRRPQRVFADTSLWEAVNMMVQNGAPVFVLEGESGKLLGAMNEHSAYAELDRLQKEGS